MMPTALKTPGDAKAIARHEVLCTLDDVVREGTRVLKPGGRFYMVHRPKKADRDLTDYEAVWFRA